MNNKIDFRRKEFTYQSFGDGLMHRAVFICKCPLCDTRIYTNDEGNDPRGVLGMHALYTLDPQEYIDVATLSRKWDRFLKPFPICWNCADNGRRMEICLEMASKKWNGDIIKYGLYKRSGGAFNDFHCGIN